MKETRMPPALAANLVENSGNTIYRVSVILHNKISKTFWFPYLKGRKCGSNGDKRQVES